MTAIPPPAETVASDTRESAADHPRVLRSLAAVPRIAGVFRASSNGDRLVFPHNRRGLVRLSLDALRRGPRETSSYVFSSVISRPARPGTGWFDRRKCSRHPAQGGEPTLRFPRRIQQADRETDHAVRRPCDASAEPDLRGQRPIPGSISVDNAQVVRRSDVAVKSALVSRPPPTRAS